MSLLFYAKFGHIVKTVCSFYLERKEVMPFVYMGFLAQRRDESNHLQELLVMQMESVIWLTVNVIKLIFNNMEY